MFCTQCGSQVASGANFCTGCGARVGQAPAQAPTQAPAPPVYTTPQAQEVVHATPVQPTRRTPALAQAASPDEVMQSAGVCDWCGEPFSAGASACARCGAMLKRTTTV